jgi:hypothetical protein
VSSSGGKATSYVWVGEDLGCVFAFTVVFSLVMILLVRISEWDIRRIHIWYVRVCIALLRNQNL